jgi:hypothetical protein
LRRCVLAVVALAAVAVVAASTGALGQQLQNSYFFNRTDVCMASQRRPAMPRPLEFCYWLNDVSCCTPANDADAKAAFVAFTSLGSGCAPADHRIRSAYREVRRFSCLACDPKEPRYRVSSLLGDTGAGGTIAADPAARPGDFVWRICLSFFFGKDGKSGLWGGDGRKFDACGIRAPAGSATTFSLPSVAFAGMAQADLAAAFVQQLPTILANFSAVVVNDSDPNFNYTNTPCFARAAPLSASCVLQLLVLALCAVLASVSRP